MLTCGEPKMQSFCVVLTVAVFSVTDGRLVFPPGSDMGYIVPDEPEQESFMDTANWLRDVDEYRAEPLRGEREADDSHASWSERRSLHQPEAAQRGPPKDLPDNLKDDKHGVAMGIPHVKCDNAKINLTLDWDYSPVNYTCFGLKYNRLPVRKNFKSVEKCIELPKNYTPQHVCMNQKLSYNTTLPTYGPHRPLWPVFGEYKFVPVQRWLHSLEHGGIVMLYDPCTEPLLVEQLRKILTGCFRKHIITPYTLLSKERPLALMAWGCSLEMATVNEAEVKAFIKTRALHGPEGHYPKNGSFKEGLLHKAKYPTKYENDSIICPENEQVVHYLR
ncbi:uncharacterized protein LOC123518541 isoform X1 [Portunus trituberculatus]|uniref:uncharacterized protein LOC123518541 isoform X1 n=2 Tax=Portunus trituberculatus TaxID=210409 RepID=UPI001E1D04E7|nr:uncharacterized protein LOC123518541 isoform X1 [Portunus trituberculatus]